MNRLGRLLAAVLFAGLTLASMATFMWLFPPKPRPPKSVPFVAYDRTAMQQALQPAAVAAQVTEITGLGSRFLGQPGFFRTEDYLRQKYTAAGLELFEQEMDSLAPHTLRRDIVAADGEPLAGVEIYPLFPNHMQPMVTPAAGLPGKLLLLTDAVLLQRPRFDDCIGVIDVAHPPEGYGLNWQRYAQLGVKALILAHHEGLDGITLATWLSLSTELQSHDPINYVRLVATAGIFAHLDETVTLHVRTEYRTVTNHTLIGVLKSKRPVKEALVITADYDAFSLLPDRAPGVLQAYGVAEQLQLLAGLLPHRDQLRRDIVFVACGTRVMACEAESRLLAALGPRLDRSAARPGLVARQQANAARGQTVQALTRLFEQADFLVAPGPSAAALGALSADARSAFLDQYHYVLNTLVLERSETMLQARLRFLKDDPDNTKSAAYNEYLAAKKQYDDAFSAAGYNVQRLLAVRRDFVVAHQLRRRVQERLAQLAAFHQASQRRLAQDLAVHDRFGSYDNLVVLSPELTPATGDPAAQESVTFYMGYGVDHRAQGPNFNNLLVGAAQQVTAAQHPVRYVSFTKDHAAQVGATVGTIPTSSSSWNSFFYPAFMAINPDRKEAYDSYALPVDKPFMHVADSLANSLHWLGESALSLAYGNGEFQESHKVVPTQYTGYVYAAGVGESVLPSYPMAGAIVGAKGAGFQYAGHLRQLFLQTDPYGRYELFGAPAAFSLQGGLYSPVAVAYGPDGRVAYAKDEGAAQDIYKSIDLQVYAGIQSDVNLVLFRAAPITILDLVNPQTMKDYAGLELVQADSLTAFPSFATFATLGPITTFLPPDDYFVVKLKAGSAENELVQTTRAVMLNTTGRASRRAPGEIQTPGYLADAQPLLVGVAHETARSMLALNGERLEALQRHHMADDRTVDFHHKAQALLAQSQQPDQPQHESILEARDSATYSILDYPVIRGAIFDAVYGILWYLFLLVPFVFFFEKLVCGFTDIRRQLAANTVIFLVVFLLLKLMHPAFEMIRSSLMILLGFIIFLISLGVIFLLSGRFRENLEALKRKRAQVTAAEVNTLGVIGTAFALGLNNMHRRKVRTGLTCATLVLITFAMLCFSTLQSNIVDSATATGKAAYQGILDKPEKFRPISDPELFALQIKYGHRFKIAPRRMYVGWETWGRERFNPTLSVSRLTAENETRKVDFDSILQLSAFEPLAPGVTMLTTNGWFTAAEAKASTGPVPIMIPEGMARKLGLTVAAVNQHPPSVMINGKEFVVKNIFVAEALANLHDPDGRNLLPFDVTAMTTVRNTGGGRFWEVLAEETDPLLSAENVALAPDRDLGITVANAWNRLVSIVIHMPGLGYREAREEISRYLEQTGKPTYYGMDGVAYLGKRFRETSVAGLLDLLIPLFIASITVLNTIRGSVYERRDEIFVYNAVGIAPRYVFFMFMAEALVYAVVGTVLGYLLAQGIGTALTALGWTGGLQLNFTSKITVYVSITIILATLVSTWFPARSALEIASPAEDSGWQLPEPDGDQLSFALPFTFHHQDRVAVLAFFHRYFLDHGEGSAGRFFAGTTQLGVSARTDPLQPDQPIPELRTAIWVKPYDLGVSQNLIIDLPTDPETREYIARITLERLSGTREAWLRLNHSFVAQVRRHFLHWRAVGKEDRDELFLEARRMLETTVTSAAK